MEAFRDGLARIMVATDIAARGLDILSISHVVNYDMPDCVDTYTHRIGRTGRVENTGEAYTFITEDDSRMVREIENSLGYRIERRTMPDFHYSTPEPFDTRADRTGISRRYRRPLTCRLII